MRNTPPPLPRAYCDSFLFGIIQSEIRVLVVIFLFRHFRLPLPGTAKMHTETGGFMNRKEINKYSANWWCVGVGVAEIEMDRL